MTGIALRSTRFEVLRQLGDGGMGVVYEAYDHETNAVVALKTLKDLDGDALYRFKNEFRALADLQHPNLVRLGELLCDNNQWFFTMELVRGRNFQEFVRPADVEASPFVASNADATRTISLPASGDALGHSPSPLGAGPRGYDEALLRHAAAQLASAIDALHRSRHVHRDIKPSNVLVRDDGHVVLLDFGLVDELAGGAAASDRRGLIMGTPQFMAPEQALDGRVGPEADWYAFGVMLFFALTGKLPFIGSPDVILEAKRRFDAPAPKALVSDVPDDLDALCHALLRRDPSARPGAQEILARLGVGSTPAEHSRRERTSDTGDVFVGRERELALLRQALTDGRAGNTVSVVVQGDAGVGKSALVRHFLDAELKLDPSAVLLSGRCYEQESVPFKGFDAIVDALSFYLSRLDEAEAAMLLRSGFRFLSTVFPVLRRVPLVGRQPPSDIVENAVATRQHAFHELKRLLSAIAENHTLVVFIDDLQWADADSLALLSMLLSPPDVPRGLFLATMRPQGERALPLPDAVTVIPLSGLSPDDARVLWRALGGAHATSESGEERWLGEAAGHPLFLSELARYARTAPRGERATNSLEDVLWRRIERLDETARHLMELVAIAGSPIQYHALARAAGLDVASCLYLLSELRTEQMVRMSRRGDTRLVEPYHDRVREAIEHKLAAAEGAASPSIRRCHLRLGWALLETTPDADLPVEVFGIVKHLGVAIDLVEDAAERRRVAELCCVAGRQAKLATAYDAARDHLDRGIALLGADPWAASYALCRSLHMERMAVEYLCGQRARAAQHFAELRERTVTDEELAELYVTKLALDGARSQYAEALESAREGLLRFGVALPERATLAHVLAEFAAVRWAQGRRRIQDIAHLPELTDVKTRCAMRLLIAVAPAAYLSNRELMALSMMRLVRLSLERGVSEETPFALVGYGTVLTGALRQYDDGHACGEVARRLTRRFAPERFISKVHVADGLFLIGWVRPMSESATLLQKGVDAAIRYGDIEYEAYGITGIAFVPYLQGVPLEVLQSQTEASHAMNVRRNQVDMMGVTRAMLGYCSALRGSGPDPSNLSTQRSSDAELRASLDDKTTGLAMFWYHYLNAELAYLTGDYARADALVGEAKKRLDRVFALPVNVHFTLLEALVAARRPPRSVTGRIAQTALLARCVRRLRSAAYACAENFEVHYLLAAAEHARVRGRHADAAGFFDKALRSAVEYGSSKREALTLELTARFLDEQGDARGASSLFAQASSAYRRWGAETKARALEQR